VLKIDTVPGNSARYARWIVRGKGPYEIHVQSTKGGVDRASIP
jgi:hypothetical protein